MTHGTVHGDTVHGITPRGDMTRGTGDTEVSVHGTMALGTTTHGITMATTHGTAHGIIIIYRHVRVLYTGADVLEGISITGTVATM